MMTATNEQKERREMVAKAMREKHEEGDEPLRDIFRNEDNQYCVVGFLFEQYRKQADPNCVWVPNSEFGFVLCGGTNFLYDTEEVNMGREFSRVASLMRDWFGLSQYDESELVTFNDGAGDPSWCEVADHVLYAPYSLPPNEGEQNEQAN